MIISTSSDDVNRKYIDGKFFHMCFTLRVQADPPKTSGKLHFETLIIGVPVI